MLNIYSYYCSTKRTNYSRTILFKKKNHTPYFVTIPNPI